MRPHSPRRGAARRPPRPARWWPPPRWSPSAPRSLPAASRRACPVPAQLPAPRSRRRAWSPPRRRTRPRQPGTYAPVRPFRPGWWRAQASGSTHRPAAGPEQIACYARTHDAGAQHGDPGPVCCRASSSRGHCVRPLRSRARPHAWPAACLVLQPSRGPEPRPSVHTCPRPSAAARESTGGIRAYQAASTPSWSCCCQCHSWDEACVPMDTAKNSGQAGRNDRHRLAGRSPAGHQGERGVMIQIGINVVWEYHSGSRLHGYQ